MDRTWGIPGSRSQTAFSRHKHLHSRGLHLHGRWGSGALSAIGRTYSVYTARPEYGDRASQLLGEYSWNIQNISAYVPTMVRNPFKCHKGAIVDWTNSDTVMRICSEDRTCMISQSVKNTNETWMLKRWCTYDKIGQATLLLGVDFNYRAWLAVAVGDPDA